MKTKRLHLRRFTAEDWKDLHEYLSDEQVVQYEPYPPQTEAQCQKAAAQRAASEDFWAVCISENGKVIGNVYLPKQAQDNWEVGYVFNRTYQKKGYATEAVTAMLQFVFSEMNAHRVYAQCNPENISSWRLLERIGFRREAHLLKNVYFSVDDNGNPRWQDTFVYGLLAEETSYET